MKQQLIESHQISPSHKYFKMCDALAFKSKNLYNATNYAIRKHYFETGKHLNYNDVNASFTHNNQVDYRALPAKVSKGTQRLLDKAYKSFFKKTGYRKPPGYLHKTKGRFVVHYEKGAVSTKIKGFVKLSKTNILIKTNKIVDFVRIVPHVGYYTIEIGYSVNLPVPSKTTGKRVASIDLGVNNLALVSSNVMNPFIINGKPVKSMNLYANLLLANTQSVTTGSSKKLRTYYRKRHNKIADYFHKSTTFIVEKLLENNIDTLVIGKNDGWKHCSKLKNFVRIPHNQFVDKLMYKCTSQGITVILQEESYTSKSSFYSKDAIPVFGVKNTITFSGKRTSRGMYIDKSGLKLNADLNGSLNILRKSEAWSDDMFEDCVTYSRKPILTYSF